MKSFILNFKGYWREAKKDGIPAVSGVYLVYRCVYNSSSGTVSLRELIYIGQATNVNKRISSHLYDGDFQGETHAGEVLCFSIAEVSKTDLDLVENALIFAQQPRLNIRGKESFDYPDSSFNIGGRCALLRYTSFSITNP